MKSKSKADFYLYAIAHNIRSLHNVGSLFRTADAAGVSKLFLTGYTPAPADRFGQVPKEIAKVALGAESFVIWQRSLSLGRVLQNLKRQNIYIIAIEQDAGASSLFDFDMRKIRTRYAGAAYIVGNEVSGISPRVLKQCDLVLEIPMRGKKESLNVSVAFGIAAFAFRSRP
jgi:tRNA G18 (ribose-2'-O)-methylase SpoU